MTSLMRDRSYQKLFLLFLVGVLFWHFPAPQGLSLQAWHLLILFVLTIITLVLKCLSMGAIAFLSMVTGCLTGVLTIEKCLDVYGKTLVWLVLFSFFIARGFTTTGLGTRIAYFFTSVFGRNVLGLSYGFALTDLLLAPAVPSNTARGAGIIFPIIKSLAEEFDGLPTPTPVKRKIGSFLIKVGFQANVITSTLFLTALAGNPLAAAFAKDQSIEISWTKWALAASLPGILCLILMPLIVYWAYPPCIKQIPNARAVAKERLKAMGPMSSPQIIMALTFVTLLGLWMFGGPLGIKDTLAGLIGIVILLLTKVLTWDDVAKEHEGWSTFIWFGALIMLGNQLKDYGVIHWFGESISTSIHGMDWVTAFAIVTLVYFYSHYFFASTTALVSTMYAIFLQVLLQSGASPFGSAMMLIGFGCLSSCLTHYGTGPAPVFFGANYVSMRDWWRIGFLLSVVYIIIWWSIGFPWWRLLGLI